MSDGAIPVQRGCGTRVKGGVYLEMGLSPYGRPIEWYIVDPPATLPDGFMLNPRGVHEQLDERTGVYHIIDWVGADSYPYPTDFTEEVRRFGMSRRMDKTFNFSLITPKSLWLGVHPRAFIKNWASVLRVVDRDNQRKWCPKEHYLDTSADLHSWAHSHYFPIPTVPWNHPRWASDPTTQDREATMCAGLWWHVLPPSDFDFDASDERKAYEPVLRSMPSFEYSAYTLDEKVKPEFEPAFFLRFPLTRLVVVNDPDDPESIKKTYAAMCRSSLPVEVVER